jgi:hypothetical protein
MVSSTKRVNRIEKPTASRVLIVVPDKRFIREVIQGLLGAVEALYYVFAGES